MSNTGIGNNVLRLGRARSGVGAYVGGMSASCEGVDI